MHKIQKKLRAGVRKMRRLTREFFSPPPDFPPQYDKAHTWTGEFRHIIGKYRPAPMQSIVEWGAGTSTVEFHKRAVQDGTRRFLTIDHNPEYLAMVLDRIPGEKRLDARVVPLQESIPGKLPAQEYLYSTAPLHFRERFDTIFVDGRARNECLLTAALIGTPGAFVMLHDFRRTRYLPGKFLFEEVESDYRGSLVLRRKKALEPLVAPFIESLPESGDIASCREYHESTFISPDLENGDDEAVRAILEQYLPKDCPTVLEWGTCGSTRALCDHLRGARPRRFFGVKARSLWFTRRLKFWRHPGLDERKASLTGACRPGARDPNFNFATAPLVCGERFHFVYVGGERRNECLLVAGLLLEPGGVVVLRGGELAHCRTGSYLYEAVEQIGDFVVLKLKNAVAEVFAGFMETLPPEARNTGIDQP